MYNVIKAQNEYVYDKRIPQWPCLCQICEKIVLLVYELKVFVPSLVKVGTFKFEILSSNTKSSLILRTLATKFKK